MGILKTWGHFQMGKITIKGEVQMEVARLNIASDFAAAAMCVCISRLMLAMHHTC